MTEQTLSVLEGRLIALRQILAMLVASHADRDAILELARERSVMNDGQEDPGAVPTTGVAIGTSVAEEYRIFVEEVGRSGQPYA
jgi:hypothetical protein